MKSLYWFRNDLRLHDNEALLEFSKKATEGLCVWCPSPSFLRAGPIRREFIFNSVLACKSSIEALGGVFIVSQFSAHQTLVELIETHKIDAVFFSIEPTPEEKKEELQLQQLSVKTFGYDTGSLIELSRFIGGAKDFSGSFTKFRNLVEKDLKMSKPLGPPLKIPSFKNLQSSEKTPMLENKYLHKHIPSGELAGLARLKSYIWDLDQLKVYKQTRNGLLDWNDSSKFSPWLSVGALSAKTVYSEIERYQEERIKNESTYWLFFELLWRDYFRLMAKKLGAQLFTAKAFDQSRFESRTQAEELFQKWAQARTDDDFINAHMTELNQTGWMSNRGRQNVASYLCHHLKVDWQKGARYFEEQLIDYDCSSNWGNWAYVAGVLPGSKEHKFDPHQQASMYDPDSAYRKRWL